MKYSEEVLLKIYETQHERFHQSRNNQWKMNITFWTLIVLAIYYHDKLPNTCLNFFICSVLFILHLVFTIRIQQNLQTDKRIWLDILKYWNDEFPKDTDFKINTRPVSIGKLEGRAWFWIIFQISFTFILFLIFLTS